MHYVVDGYNLLFAFFSEGSMPKQRGILIEELSAKAALLNIDLTLVFDAQNRSEETRRSHFKDIEIVYTSKGQSADDYIVSKLEFVKDPSKYTAITSDGELIKRIKNRGSHVLTLEQFAYWLIKRSERATYTVPTPIEEIFPLESSEMQRWLHLFEENLNKKDKK